MSHTLYMRVSNARKGNKPHKKYIINHIAYKFEPY